MGQRKLEAKKSKKVSPKVKQATRTKSAITKTGDYKKIKIKVIGIGGGGGNIVNELASLVPKVEFWIANTDIQALKRISKKNCHILPFGQSLTKGLGTGSNPKLGELAAKQDSQKISRLFKNTHLCILISCLGGGTGSGALPVFAELARQQGCLTLGIFILPFRFEGKKKTLIARQSLAKAIPELSASVVFSNEKIFKIADAQTGFQAALSAVNSILGEDLKNFINLIFSPGLINIDFADLKTILKERGQFAFLASAKADTPDRVNLISQQLFSHPLNDYNPRGAKNILFNIATGKEISIQELNHISQIIFSLNPQAKIIFGVSQNSNLNNSLVLTLLAIGSFYNFPSSTVESKKVSSKSTSKQKSLPVKEAEQRQTKKEKNITPRLDQESARKGGTHKTSDAQTLKVNAVQRSIKPKKLQKNNPVLKSKFLKKEKKAKKMLPGSKTKKLFKITKTSSSQSQAKNREIKKIISRSALDIKKEMELMEKEQIIQEKKWDIPAFLRRQT